MSFSLVSMMPRGSRFLSEGTCLIVVKVPDGNYARAHAVETAIKIPAALTRVVALLGISIIGISILGVGVLGLGILGVGILGVGILGLGITSGPSPREELTNPLPLQKLPIFLSQKIRNVLKCTYAKTIFQFI